MRKAEIDPSYREKLDAWANSFVNQTLMLANGTAHARTEESSALKDFYLPPYDMPGIDAFEREFECHLTSATEKGIVVFDNPSTRQVIGLKAHAGTLDYIHIDRLKGVLEDNSLRNYCLGFKITSRDNVQMLVSGEKVNTTLRQIVFSSEGKYSPKNFFIATAPHETPSARQMLLLNHAGKVMIRKLF